VVDLVLRRAAGREAPEAAARRRLGGDEGDRRSGPDGLAHELGVGGTVKQVTGAAGSAVSGAGTVSKLGALLGG
jgi:hypothetical protein